MKFAIAGYDRRVGTLLIVEGTILSNSEFAIGTLGVRTLDIRTSLERRN